MKERPGGGHRDPQQPTTDQPVYAQSLKKADREHRIEHGMGQLSSGGGGVRVVQEPLQLSRGGAEQLYSGGLGRRVEQGVGQPSGVSVWGRGVQRASPTAGVTVGGLIKPVKPSFSEGSPSVRRELRFEEPVGQQDSEGTRKDTRQRSFVAVKKEKRGEQI